MTPYDRLLKQLRDQFNISEDFHDACDHDYDCRCSKCLQWWREAGPDEDGLYGPFTKDEIEGDINVNE